MMIIEILGFSPRGGGINGLGNCLYIYGNNLHREPGMNDEDFLYPLDSTQKHVFIENDEWAVNPYLDYIMIRGQRVAVDLSPQSLTAKGIELIDPPEIDPPALMRSLIPDYRDHLLASDSELCQRNPHNIPLLMTLEEWHHPDICGEELPSQSETFQMLAVVIETGQIENYNPTKSPNTHWSNWPFGGSL